MADAKKIIAGVAAATGLAVAAKKTYDAKVKDGASQQKSKSSSSGTNGKAQASNGQVQPKIIYHVKPNGEGWTVEAEGAQRATSRHDNKRSALDAARDLANQKAPSRLIIHRADGTIQRQHSYGLEA